MDWNEVLTIARTIETMASALDNLKATYDDDDATISPNDAVLLSAAMLCRVTSAMLCEWYEGTEHAPRVFTKEDLM